MFQNFKQFSGPSWYKIVLQTNERKEEMRNIILTQLVFVADFGKSHFKELAKHGMLAHLMLPPCFETSSPKPERRITCHGPPASMHQIKEGQ